MMQEKIQKIYNELVFLRDYEIDMDDEDSFHYLNNIIKAIEKNKEIIQTE